MANIYKNLVFTKHALERVSDRTITQDAIYQAVNQPDQHHHSRNKQKFIRTINDRRIHVVAKPIENHQWLVISVWARGEEDREPLMWQLIVAPFRLINWLLKSLFTKRSKQA